MISLIIPAYNSQRQIENCIASILAQTYQDFEVLIINDGSTDNTANIINQLSKKDNRIKLINIDNSGPAKAREIGILSTSINSDYIFFCDADDELCHDALEKAINASNGSDLTILGYTLVNTDGSTNNFYEPDGCYSIDTFGQVFSNLYKANLLNQVWGKLYKTSFIKNNSISFPNYRWGEDRFFIFDCLEYASQITVSSSCVYLYNIQPSDSLISNFFENKPLICKEIDIRVENLRHKYMISDDNAFKYMFAKSIFSCMANMFTSSCNLSFKEKKEYTRKILTDNYIIDRITDVNGNLYIKLISKIMLSKYILLNIFIAKFASVSSKVLPKLFEKIKHKK